MYLIYEDKWLNAIVYSTSNAYSCNDLKRKVVEVNKLNGRKKKQLDCHRLLSGVYLEKNRDTVLVQSEKVMLK